LSFCARDLTQALLTDAPTSRVVQVACWVHLHPGALYAYLINHESLLEAAILFGIGVILV
jgi:hypothetical protein